jgi:hypothetical protein
LQLNNKFGTKRAPARCHVADSAALIKQSRSGAHMDLDLDQLAQAVLRLPDAARAELATRLLESLDAGDTIESAR